MSTPAPILGPAKGPELGSFPLDHFRECKAEVQDYYRCLEKNDNIAPMCRDLVRAYLRCRMDRGLMTKTDLDNFNLPHTDFVPTRMHKIDTRRDAFRAGGTAAVLGAKWESDFKSRDIQVNDGYEAVRGTLTPVEVQEVPRYVPQNERAAAARAQP